MGKRKRACSMARRRRRYLQGPHLVARMRSPDCKPAPPGAVRVSGSPAKDQTENGPRARKP